MCEEVIFMDTHKIKAEWAALESRWHKLLFLVGLQNGEGQLLSKALNIPYLNLNRHLSEKLQNIPKASYPLQVGEILNKWMEEYEETAFCIGDMEILFDKQLQQHPIRLLENLSKRFKLIVCWPGQYDGKSLTYAMPAHPEYFTCSDFEGSVITV
jgi:hypothetical protein